MAIDAPIVLHTHIGQRPCEIEVDRRFGRFHVPSRTANLAVYPDRPILFCFKFAANAAFTVATVRFEVLFVLVVLAHDRRRVRHFNITAHPAAAWTAQQIVEAFPWETAQRSLLRDRDGMYGADFRERVASMGIEEVLTAPRSPWQSPYVERVIGSIRRACLDNVVVLYERHLRRILAAYFDHYHRWRCHQGSTWTARSRGRSSRPSRVESSRSPKATVSTGTTSAGPPDSADHWAKKSPGRLPLGLDRVAVEAVDTLPGGADGCRDAAPPITRLPVVGRAHSAPIIAPPAAGTLHKAPTSFLGRDRRKQG